MAAAVAICIIGAVHHGVEFSDTFSSGAYTEQKYEESYDSTITHALLELDAGAGKCIIGGTTDSLLSATAKSRFGDFKFNATKKDSGENFTVSMNGGRGWYIGGGTTAGISAAAGTPQLSN